MDRSFYKNLIIISLPLIAVLLFIPKTSLASCPGGSGICVSTSSLPDTFYTGASGTSGADIYKVGITLPIATHELSAISATGNLSTTTWDGGSFDGTIGGDYIVVTPTVASCAAVSYATCAATNPSMGPNGSSESDFHIPSTTPETIQNLYWNFPVNLTDTASSTNSFPNWVLTLNNNSTSTSGTIRVDYGRATSTGPFFTDTRYYPSLGPASYNIQVPRTTSLDSGFWFAKAYLLDATSTATSSPVYSTNWIEFNLHNALPPAPGIQGFSTSTLATDPFFVDCSSYSGGFFSSSTLAGLGCYAQKVTFATIGFLVVPPDWINKAMSQSFTGFTSVPPFNVTFGALSAIQNAASSTLSSPYADSAIVISQIGLNTGPLLSSSTLTTEITNAHCNTACAESITNKLFNVERIFIYLGAVVSVVIMLF